MMVVVVVVMRRATGRGRARRWASGGGGGGGGGARGVACDEVGEDEPDAGVAPRGQRQRRQAQQEAGGGGQLRAQLRQAPGVRRRQRRLPCARRTITLRRANALRRRRLGIRAAPRFIATGKLSFPSCAFALVRARARRCGLLRAWCRRSTCVCRNDALLLIVVDDGKALAVTIAVTIAVRRWC